MKSFIRYLISLSFILFAISCGKSTNQAEPEQAAPKSEHQEKPTKELLDSRRAQLKSTDSKVADELAKAKKEYDVAHSVHKEINSLAAYEKDFKDCISGLTKEEVTAISTDIDSTRARLDAALIKSRTMQITMLLGEVYGHLFAADAYFAAPEKDRLFFDSARAEREFGNAETRAARDRKRYVEELDQSEAQLDQIQEMINQHNLKGKVEIDPRDFNGQRAAGLNDEFLSRVTMPASFSNEEKTKLQKRLGDIKSKVHNIKTSFKADKPR